MVRGARCYSLTVFLFGCCLALLGTASPSAAAIITTDDGNGADTYVERGAGTSNFGTSPNLTVKRGTADNSSNNRQGFIRFDLSSVSPGTGSPGNDIESAILQLTVQTFSNATGTAMFNIYGYLNGQGSENFGETTLTRNTAAGIIDSATSINTALPIWANGGNPLAQLTLTNGDAGKTFDISTPELLAFLNADTNNLVTFVVTRLTTGNSTTDNALNSGFAAREHETLAPPTLVLTMIPEPSSVGLGILLAGGVAATVWRRRAK